MGQLTSESLSLKYEKTLAFSSCSSNWDSSSYRDMQDIDPRDVSLDCYNGETLETYKIVMELFWRLVHSANLLI